ncbi:protein arginine N-methyltransferase 1 [Fopius arisanus]|uniref:type I protein arginine methyltransferase n=3 Tax=Fopius arisanus TaxID=64838 RepID=A0A9R1SW55_9HYME|nr:PREDICTED: protein arginine N-methyltransferase 1 [Fopius arisanus]
MTDNVPDLVSSHDMDLVCSDGESGEDWDEIDDDSCRISCLFCEKEFRGYCEGLKHMSIFHGLDLGKFVRDRQLDDYTYRKFVNYVRKHRSSPEELAAGGKPWDADEYLMPVLQDDPWLMLDIEELDQGSPEDTKVTSFPVNCENGCVTLSETHFAELQRTIQSLKAQLEQRETACYLAKQQIDEMQRKVQRIVFDEETEKPSKRCVKNVGAVDDEGYFNTYSHFAIHHEMLTDTVRTESYRDALLTNSHVFRECTMLDVGCGTGILSMFAAKSGCKKVLSVDQSDVIYHAMDIVRENNLNDVIELKKGRLEDIDLGVEKVDAIVSEWMGYFLLFEGMLDTVIYARDHYLKPGGKLLPNRCTLTLVGSGDTKRYVDLVDYWSNVYGFKMSCMKEKVVKEPSIEVCSAKDIVTSVSIIRNFDLFTVDTSCMDFTTEFELIVKKTGSLTAIVGYFDVFFDLDNPVSFSTGPQTQATHWKQTVFSLSEPISITEGETITGKIICGRHPKDIRALIVTLHVRDFRQVYYLD